MLEIVNIKIADIKPFENNAKSHPPEQIQQIKRSITEFGMNDPIAVDENNVVVEGHGRLLALKELDFDEAPCIKLTHLGENEKRAYILAHNKLTLNTGFDLGLLTSELDFLRGGGFDVSLAGFDASEIDELFKDNAPKQAVEDTFDIDKAAEEIETPVSKRGDIWLLGRHRLMCGDALEHPDADILMDGQKAKLIITDLPYNVAYSTGGNKNHPSWKKREGILNDDMLQKEFAVFLRKAYGNMRRIAEDGCIIYAFMSAQEWGTQMQAMQECGYHWSSTIIWNKDTLVLSRKDYHTKYEPIWYGWVEGAPRLCPLEDRKQSDVWEVARPKRSELHPTMKPIPLLSIAMNNSSKETDIVTDFFGGSGSTLITAEQLGRVCYTMELSEKFADVIVKRYISLVGSDDSVFLIRDGKRLTLTEAEAEVCVNG